MIRRILLIITMLCALIVQALPAAAAVPMIRNSLGAAQGARARSTRFVRETLRGHGPISPAYREDRQDRGLAFDWSTAVSPDLRRFARVQPAGGPVWVELDGQVFPDFEDLHLLRDAGPMVFSADSRHFAYSGESGEGEWTVVLDGKTQGTYPAAHSLAFSPLDGAFSYVAQSDKGQYLIVDGIGVGSYYPAIVKDSLLYSPDGYVAYVAQNAAQAGAGEDGQQFVVLNGQSGKAYDAVDRLVFGKGREPTGRGTQLAYVAATGEEVRVVLSGAGQVEEGPLHDEIAQTPVFFGEDGGVLYAAREGERWLLFRLSAGGVEREAEYAGITQPAVSPDGSRLAYGAGDGEKAFAIVDGVKGPEYDYVTQPVFSPDGKKVAYIASKDDLWLAVIDGVEGKLYGDVGVPIFSADSSRFAYVAKASTLSGDVAVAPQPGSTEGRSIQNVAYREGEGGLWNTAFPRAPQAQEDEGLWRWVIDGKETEAYDFLLFGPSFSPDNSRFAFAAARGNKQFVVLVDDRGEHTGEGYDSIVASESGTVRFDDDNNFHYLAIDDGREPPEHGAFADVWLVEERITETAQPGTVGIGDPYYPTLGNGGYDAQHYTVELDYDPATNALTGTTTMTARATYPLSAFNLDFQGFEVGVPSGPGASAVMVNGEAAAFERAESELTITPAAPLEAGALFTVSVAYGGTPLPGEAVDGSGDRTLGWRTTTRGADRAGDTIGLTVSVDESTPVTEVVSILESLINTHTAAYLVTIPNGTSALFPVNDHMQDKATYTFRVHVPDPYMVVANGVAGKTETDDTGATYVWQVDDPMSSHFAEVVVAELEQEVDQAHSVPIYRYFEDGLPETAPTEFEHIGDMLDYFASIFGPYPFPSYSIVQLDDPWRDYAIEGQGLGLYTNPCTGQPLFGGEEGETDCQELSVVAEVAHQWFGGSVSPKTWRDAWINEAFALYAGWLWQEHTDGPGAFDEIKRQLYAGLTVIPPSPDNEEGLEFLPAFEDWILAADNPPPGTPVPSRLLGGGVTVRAALALHALRLRLGDETFFDILRTFTDRFRHSNATTADFFAVAEEVSGEDLAEFVDSWFYAYALPSAETVGGFPTLTVVAPALNVRSGPGTNYARVNGLATGDVLEITGQAFDCGWLQIRRADGSEGWVAGGAQYVTFTTPCSALPVAAIPDTPAPTTATTAPLTNDQAAANIEAAVAAVIGQPAANVLAFFDTVDDGTPLLFVFYQTGFDPVSQSSEINTQHRRAVFAAVDGLVRASSRPEGMVVLVYPPGPISDDTEALRGAVVLRPAAEAWSNGQMDDAEFAATWELFP